MLSCTSGNMATQRLLMRLLLASTYWCKFMCWTLAICQHKLAERPAIPRAKALLAGDMTQTSSHKVASASDVAQTGMASVSWQGRTTRWKRSGGRTDEIRAETQISLTEPKQAVCSQPDLQVRFMNSLEPPQVTVLRAKNQIDCGRQSVGSEPLTPSPL